MCAFQSGKKETKHHHLELDKGRRSWHSNKQKIVEPSIEKG